MKIKDLLAHCDYADWFYLRTGSKATTGVGEHGRSKFLQGELVIVRMEENRFSMETRKKKGTE